jgi:hypothetical protein
VAWYQQSSPGQYTVIRAPGIKLTTPSMEDDDDSNNDDDDGDAVWRLELAATTAVRAAADAAFMLGREFERSVVLLLSSLLVLLYVCVTVTVAGVGRFR